MIILHIKPQEISLLQTKKSVISGSNTSWASHNFAKPFIKDGSFASIDILASAMKEVIADTPKLAEKEALVVLDHSLYKLLRVEIPVEIQKSEYHSYLKQKYSESEKGSSQECVFEMIVKEFETKKFGFIYTFEKSTLATLEQAANLVDLKMSSIVPEHLAFYALFEKTLRLDKHEHILYAQYESDTLEGYYFDTFGPLPSFKPWKKDKLTMSNIESYLKEKSENFAKDMPKLNRIVVSGSDSEKIRQDTFTKNVGVWTNPLKRILPHFYQEYLNLLKSKQESAPIFPALKLSALFGGFITSQDNKAFPFQKIGSQKSIKIDDVPVIHSSNTNMSAPNEKKPFRIPKEIILFVVIFIITFALFYFVAVSKSEGGLNIPMFTKPTETPTPSPSPEPPTPTPTIEVKREEVNIKVLNGTGVAGQAGGLKAALLKAGYVGVLTDNATRYDYTQSVLQIKSGKEYLQSKITEDMKDFITSPKVETLDETEKADVVIIIGSDIK